MWTNHISAEDMASEELTEDMFTPHPRPYRGDSRTMDDTLNVSVTLFSGDVLCTVPVSGGSSVWELKCCIAKTILQGQMHQRRMTLMYGSHILTDATLVRDAGIATGAMLSVIRTAPYKILVGRGDIAELWNHEGRLDAVLRGHEDAITDVQFSPDTNLAITCSFDSTAKLWGVGSQECLFTLKHERMVVTGAFSTTGTTVVTTMFSHELKQWCVRSGDCISTLRLSHKGAFDFAFTAQGVHVLHTVEDCITLWNMETGTRVWDHHVGFPLWYQPHACLSRCGNWFCTLIRDVRAGPVRNTADIWNATTCSHYRGVTVPSGIVDRVEFSPDAWCLFAVCTNGNVTIWSLGHDPRSHTFKHEGTVESAEFSPDGLQLITIAKRRAWLWRLDDDSLGWCIPQWHVSIACFTPDSKGVLLTCRTGTEEWDVASRECCWKVDGEPVTAIAFSSQNKRPRRH